MDEIALKKMVEEQIERSKLLQQQKAAKLKAQQGQLNQNHHVLGTIPVLGNLQQSARRSIETQEDFINVVGGATTAVNRTLTSSQQRHESSEMSPTVESVTHKNQTNDYKWKDKKSILDIANGLQSKN